MKAKRIYTEKEAEIYGRRKVCASEGHEISTPFDRGLRGGEQMQYDRYKGQPISACDQMSCDRCDAIITVTYPEIGTVQ
jgi:hypothetical protein